MCVCGSKNTRKEGKTMAIIRNVREYCDDHNISWQNLLQSNPDECRKAAELYTKALGLQFDPDQMTGYDALTEVVMHHIAERLIVGDEVDNILITEPLNTQRNPYVGYGCYTGIQAMTEGQPFAHIQFKSGLELVTNVQDPEWQHGAGGLIGDSYAELQEKHEKLQAHARPLTAYIHEAQKLAQERYGSELSHMETYAILGAHFEAHAKMLTAIYHQKSPEKAIEVAQNLAKHAFRDVTKEVDRAIAQCTAMGNKYAGYMTHELYDCGRDRQYNALVDLMHPYKESNATHNGFNSLHQDYIRDAFIQMTKDGLLKQMEQNKDIVPTFGVVRMLDLGEDTLRMLRERAPSGDKELHDYATKYVNESLRNFRNGHNVYPKETLAEQALVDAIVHAIKTPSIEQLPIPLSNNQVRTANTIAQIVTDQRGTDSPEEVQGIVKEALTAYMIQLAEHHRRTPEIQVKGTYLVDIDEKTLEDFAYNYPDAKHGSVNQQMETMYQTELAEYKKIINETPLPNAIHMTAHLGDDRWEPLVSKLHIPAELAHNHAINPYELRNDVHNHIQDRLHAEITQLMKERMRTELQNGTVQLTYDGQTHRIQIEGLSVGLSDRGWRDKYDEPIPNIQSSASEPYISEKYLPDDWKDYTVEVQEHPTSTPSQDIDWDDDDRDDF